MQSMGCLIGVVVGMILVVGLCLTLVCALIVNLVLPHTAQATPFCTPKNAQSTCVSPSTVSGAHVAALATTMAQALYQTCTDASNPACWYKHYDPAKVPAPVLRYINQVCGGCAVWSPNNFQCVSFVRAAYSEDVPMTATNDAFPLWATYATQPGWSELPDEAGLPQQRSVPEPGDVMILRHAVWTAGRGWTDLSVGHVGIVLSVVHLRPEGWTLTFASANSVLPVDSFTLNEDFTPDRRDTAPHPIWSNFQLWGFLRPFTTTTLPASPYVSIAYQAAIEAGIPPDMYVRQINEESHFDPAARSPKGALGIAQLMPETARLLGVDPLDPIASLHAAARLMATYLHQYSHDEAKALSAYNWGPGTTTAVIETYGANWLAYVPAETHQYIQQILGPHEDSWKENQYDEFFFLNGDVSAPSIGVYSTADSAAIGAGGH
ncbi:MAG TPA: transglycosylase SLT domain-containing protein [Ktedonobacteraceae bacterium]|nr:transglycosylase SLT domain-containing protein [Ktedonobacteraceae bacterium]